MSMGKVDAVKIVKVIATAALVESLRIQNNARDGENLLDAEVVQVRQKLVVGLCGSYAGRGDAGAGESRYWCNAFAITAAAIALMQLSVAASVSVRQRGA